MPRLKQKFFEAQKLRKSGYSLKEISQKVNVSKSTASFWSRGINLSDKAHKRLLKVVSRAQFISAEKRISRTNYFRRQCENKGEELIKQIKIDDNILRLFCGLMYWCEGSKMNDNVIQFTNSEPKLAKAFVGLLRKSFVLEENKFRVSLHLHNYHSVKKQIKFWSELLKISQSQFIKPYIKSNTGKRVKDDYQGCANIRYNDAKLAKELLGIGRAFLEKFGS